MQERPVAFPSGDIMMAGVVATPDGDGPFPTALLIAGSGPIDRDGNHKKMALNTSRDLARVLAEAGWASLRFDKRGVGQSGGVYVSTGFFEELADAQAALGWLEHQPGFGSVVAIGHSAGALMAAELATGGGVIGSVLLATSAKNGEETLRWQTLQMQDHVVPGPMKAVLKVFGTDVVKQQAKAIDKLKSTTGDTARIQLAKVNAKWMREYIAYDPVPALRNARVPLLAITGAKDVQVDPDDLQIVAEIAPNTDVFVAPDVDHLLRPEPAPFSNVRKYKEQAKKPMDPAVVERITDWLGRYP